MAVDSALFPSTEGSSDSEVRFYLAFTFGLDQDVPGAVARTEGLVEHLGKEHGVPDPLQMTVAESDGERVWAFRYFSLGRSRSLFALSPVPTAHADERAAESCLLHGCSRAATGGFCWRGKMACGSVPELRRGGAWSGPGHTTPGCWPGAVQKSG